ncbi:MAG: PAS domain S-box protein [Oligoflexia bacterium]|nr:PAS domain S-box protein [Oligoflexia bacterium]
MFLISITETEKKYIYICGVFSIVVGLLAILFWIINHTEILAGNNIYIPMAPNSALLFIICGIELIIGVLDVATNKRLRFFVFLSLNSLVFLLSSINLIELLFDVNLHSDYWLLVTTGFINGIQIGRMSSITAAGFFLLALIFLFFSLNKKGIATFLNITLLFINTILIIGYIYGAPFFYGGTIKPVSLLTAITFLIMSIGLTLAIGKNVWPVRLLVGQNRIAVLMRLILPATLLFVMFCDFISHEIAIYAKMGEADSAALLFTLIMFFAPFLSYLLSKKIKAQLKEANENLQKNRKLLQAIVNGTPDAIYVKDLCGRYLLLNKSAEQLIGKKAEEVIGRDDQFLFPAVDAAEIMETDRKILSACNVVTYEEKFKYFSSKINSTYLTTKGPIKDIKGRVFALFGITRDVTELKKVEEAIRDAEGRLRFAMKVSKIGAWDLDLINHSAYRSIEHAYIFGYGYKDFIDKKWTYEMFLEHVLPEDRQMVYSKFQHATKTKTNCNFECRIRRADGEIRWIWSTGQHKFNAHGVADRMSGIVQDITERKQTELELQNNLNTLNETGRIAKVGGMEFNVITGKQKWTNEMFRIFEMDVFVGHEPPWSESLKLISQESREIHERALKRAIENGESYEIEVEIITKKGNRKWVRETGTAKLENGQVVSISGTIQDISERKRMEAALIEKERKLAEVMLQESEARLYRAIIQSPFPAMIYTTDDGQVLAISSGWTEITGYTIDDIPTIADWIYHAYGTQKSIDQDQDQDQNQNHHQEKINLLYKAVVKVKENDHFIKIKSGEQRVWDFMLAPIGTLPNGNRLALSIGIDTTEKRQMQEHLQRTQKLDSLGVMAGGIAHDLNNLLSGIFGFMELAKEDCEKEDFQNVLSYLTNATEMFNRAKDLSHQLLTFSKGGLPLFKLQSVVPLLKSSVQFILCGSNVIAVFDLSDDLWFSNIDENQFNQVINNIVINTKQAMPLGGTIKISAYNIPLASPLPAPLTPGNYICISIEDNGEGISPEHLPKIFDPFFTTKQHGSGLGLATVYSIIKKHNGFIDVKSELGKGTTFYLYLPAILTSPSGEELEKNEKKDFFPACKILFMDDEYNLRVLIGNYFKELKAKFTSVASGEEALKIFKEAYDSGSPFEIVICDLTIPGGKGGAEIIDDLRSIDSNFMAIVSSGYSDKAVMSMPKHYGFDDSLSKPYGKSDLIDVLKKNLSILESRGKRLLK